MDRPPPWSGWSANRGCAAMLGILVLLFAAFSWWVLITVVAEHVCG